LFFEVLPSSLLQVLVRNVPPDPDESVNEHVEHFFCVNHPDHYLCHQVRFFSWLKVNSSTISRKPLIENYLVSSFEYVMRFLI